MGNEGSKLEVREQPGSKGHTMCRGAMNNNVLCLWCRRGLLAYVYTGVSY